TGEGATQHPEGCCVLRGVCRIAAALTLRDDAPGRARTTWMHSAVGVRGDCDAESVHSVPACTCVPMGGGAARPASAFRTMVGGAHPTPSRLGEPGYLTLHAPVRAQMRSRLARF